MIQVDLTHMRRFIALPYEAALAPRLRIAHNHLQKGDGAGGDFTGWVRLPQEYDRQEFDRIQAAARRIQSDSRALVVASTLYPRLSCTLIFIDNVSSSLVRVTTFLESAFIAADIS